MKILIGADIVPTISNQQMFENEQMDQIVDDKLLEILKNADYRIFNLEVPLTDKAEPIKKCGPNLIASTNSAKGLKQLGIDFLTLANNHILDQGEQGLWSTVKLLNNVGIAWAGVGKNPLEAAKPYIAEIGGKKIGIYCCAEHEFSIVTESSAGANPFDPLESLDHIVALKTQCDYVICLYHGGKEHYRYPSPGLQKTCRKIIDKGADLVICQHTHCIGCEEKWGNGTIVYGQGNFLFDHSDSEYWKTSLLIQIGKDFEISYIPIVKRNDGVQLADELSFKQIVADFERRSREIQTSGWVEKAYANFAMTQISWYLSGSSGKKSRLFKALNKLSRGRFLSYYITKTYGVKELNALQNYLECEAHNELFVTGIQNYAKKH